MTSTPRLVVRGRLLVDATGACRITTSKQKQDGGVDVEGATLDLLIANRLEVSAVMAVRDERSVENLARLFAHPAHTGGSDGIFVGDVPHRRAPLTGATSGRTAHPAAL